jgi:hypothetical protein
MPFVESGQEPQPLGEHREMVERDGPLHLSQVIGCQMYMSSDVGELRLITTAKEAFFSAAEKILPHAVKKYLDPLGFYQIPDPSEVDKITEEAANMPTELFVRIQERYDPDYLFLPEIDHFLFRYPRPNTPGTGADSAFGFVQVSAFLLDNCENRIVSKGSGCGLKTLETSAGGTEEGSSIPQEVQLETMEQAGDEAIRNLLLSMKMI